MVLLHSLAQTLLHASHAGEQGGHGPSGPVTSRSRGPAWTSNSGTPPGADNAARAAAVRCGPRHRSSTKVAATSTTILGTADAMAQLVSVKAVWAVAVVGSSFQLRCVLEHETERTRTLLIEDNKWTSLD